MRNYIVIGGSSGIGKALCDVLALEHNVFASYNQHPTSNTERTTYFKLNVLEEPIDVSLLPEQIDGLVYCPGSISLKPFARASQAELMQAYQLNVLGAVSCIQSILPKLKNSTCASIVLFSTVAVQLGLPFHSIVSSCKGAVEGLTKSLAAEFAPNIRVNCIAPSLTATPLANALLNSEEKIKASADRHPLKRVGTATEIATFAKFLLTEESSWITGQILHIDGGMSTIK